MTIIDFASRYPLQILIVDPILQRSRLVQLFLHYCGYVPETASDARSALEALYQKPEINCLLINDNLNGPNSGVALYQKIRCLRQITAVLLTDQAENSTLGAQAFKAGFVGVTDQPLDRNRILVLLGRAHCQLRGIEVPFEILTNTGSAKMPSASLGYW